MAGIEIEEAEQRQNGMTQRDLMDTFPASGEAVYEGIVKLKLVHANGLSLLLPDLVAIDIDGWKWFQPKFFSACLLSFYDDAAYGQFNIDTDTGARLFIGVTKDRLVRSFADGSQIYRCRVSGPKALDTAATGTCIVNNDGAIFIPLFHHTLPATVATIQQCGYFLGSTWNIQGTKKLENVAYAYFTSLPAIRSEDDLRGIAMASDARIGLLTTNGKAPRDVIAIEVYRQNTWDRRATMQVIAPAELIASQHVWRHAPNGEAVYYEVSHSKIARIGLKPNQVLPFSNGQICPTGDEIKRFDYVILGDADTQSGLIAPYDEENTESRFLIAPCGTESFFDFWQKNSNSDQVTGRKIETQRVQSD